MELYPPHTDLVDQIVNAALDEDRARLDISTAASVDPEQLGVGVIWYKEDAVVSGLQCAASAFRQLDVEVVWTPLVHDGDFVQEGHSAARIEGKLAAILSAERVALNLLQRLSGTATATHHLVSLVEEFSNTTVVDTRKTTPGLRSLERYAVRCGGGRNHRDNLQDGILIKDNHIKAARMRNLSLSQLIERIKQNSPHLLKIEIEADSKELAEEAYLGGADIIMLDNMAPSQMKDVISELKLKDVGRRVLFEASGNINSATIRSVAEAGVDIVSVGAVTHSVKATDIALDIDIY